MKTASCIGRVLLALLLVVGAWALWVVRGHEGRTWGRLIAARVVSAEHHGRLLYSTGYLRENSHVFECPPADILDAKNGGAVFHPVDPGNENHARFIADHIRPLLERCVQPPLDWQHVEVCNAEGAGLLSEVFTVKAGDRFFVVLMMF